jgi:hypothetical protein
MKQKDILETILSELGMLYKTPPGEKSIKKFKVLFKKFGALDFDDESIKDYIDFCYKKMKKMVKEPEKRAGVNYFSAIIASEKMFTQYLDLQRIKGEALRDNPVEQDEMNDERIMHVGRDIYHRIKEDGDRSIFFCPIKIKFLIKDYSEMIPKVYRLSTYNFMHPEKKITMDTIEKDMIKWGRR